MPKQNKDSGPFPYRVTGYPTEEVYKLFEQVTEEYPDFGTSKHLNAAMRWYARDVLAYGLDAHMNPMGHVEEKKKRR